jgi:hypothetical protein
MLSGAKARHPRIVAAFCAKGVSDRRNQAISESA